VVVRSVRELYDVRLFQLPWPVTNGEAIRRVAIVPRGWIQGMGEGWTCVDDSIASIACVSIDTRPNPLVVRVSPVASTRGAWIATALFSLSLWAWSTLRKPEEERLATAVTWFVALIATSSVALTLVGARCTSWCVALSLAALGATALAALVDSDDGAGARRLGAMAALALALLSVFDGRPLRSLAVLAAATVALVVARWFNRESQRPNLPRTDPPRSEEEASRLSTP
jgi:hypothetical protein